MEEGNLVRNLQDACFRILYCIFSAGISHDFAQILFMDENKNLKEVSSRRPKARGLAQHGGPPGWLEESDPCRV
jgi:hypothetical protein